MQFCTDHWNKLRLAIANRGIDHLVAKDGEAAITNEIAKLSGETGSYDPLMACHWMITNRALEFGGLYLMFPKEDGSQHCPVCEALLHSDGDEGYWIDGPADVALRECKERGLIIEN